jgi:hypothetical protein
MENNDNNVDPKDQNNNQPNNLPELDLENDPRVQEHVKGLKNKVNELLTKVNQIKKPENIDIGLTKEEIEELKQLKEARKKEQEEKLKTENPDELIKSKILEVESQYKKLLEKERKEVEERDRILNEFKSKETFQKIEKEIIKRASTDIRKLKDVEIEEQKEYIKEKFEFNDDGVLVSKDNKINNQGERYNIDDYFNDLATRRPYLFDQIPSGSGTKSTTSSTSTKFDGKKKLTLEEASYLLEHDPEKYKEMKKQGLGPF